jgi:hypothetical protein
VVRGNRGVGLDAVFDLIPAFSRGEGAKHTEDHSPSPLESLPAEVGVGVRFPTRSGVPSEILFQQ